MMMNTPLRTWINHHLNKGDIPGLEEVKEPGFPSNTFKFPWVKIGDPGWEEKWSVIFVSCYKILNIKNSFKNLKIINFNTCLNANGSNMHEDFFPKKGQFCTKT